MIHYFLRPNRIRNLNYIRYMGNKQIFVNIVGTKLMKYNSDHEKL